MRIAILASIRPIRIRTNIITKMLPEVVLRVNGETPRVVISWSANAVVYLCNFPVERLPPHPCRQVHVIAVTSQAISVMSRVSQNHVTVTLAFTRLPCVTSQIAQLTTATSLLPAYGCSA